MTNHLASLWDGVEDHDNNPDEGMQELFLEKKRPSSPGKGESMRKRLRITELKGTL